jgi:hypothetical protein
MSASKIKYHIKPYLFWHCNYSFCTCRFIYESATLPISLHYLTVIINLFIKILNWPNWYNTVISKNST